MLPQQMDVNVPLALRSQLGTLLAQFEDYARQKGFVCRRRRKLDGRNHVTDWWLMLIVDGQGPKKSEVQYGETVFAGVNPTPHLWVRAKDAYRQAAYKLLRDFFAHLQAPPPSPPPPPAPAKTVGWDWDGSEYGPDYLTLRAGDRIVSRIPPERPEGWAYGLLLGAGGRFGWYPPAFAL